MNAGGAVTLPTADPLTRPSPPETHTPVRGQIHTVLTKKDSLPTTPILSSLAIWSVCGIIASKTPTRLNASPNCLIKSKKEEEHVMSTVTQPSFRRSTSRGTGKGTVNANILPSRNHAGVTHTMPSQQDLVMILAQKNCMKPNV